jgi:hypothetical protein
MAIIHQCEDCTKKGKNVYCSNCKKSIDYFDVYEYNNEIKNRYSDGEAIGVIKAFTWHDAIEFIKVNFFGDKKNLDINCEKEFAYIEGKIGSSLIDNGNRNLALSYKIYLNNEEKTEFKELSRNLRVWDTTTINNSKNNDA